MRNERYRKNAISVRERHNERKNEVYSNPDVLLEYSHNNVTFKACEAATYAQQFDRMVEEGVVSTRGLKPDAYVFDELVFDVNTDYFETHGGYAHLLLVPAVCFEHHAAVLCRIGSLGDCGPCCGGRAGMDGTSPPGCRKAAQCQKGARSPAA